MKKVYYIQGYQDNISWGYRRGTVKVSDLRKSCGEDDGEDCEDILNCINATCKDVDDFLANLPMAIIDNDGESIYYCAKSAKEADTLFSNSAIEGSYE